MICGYVLIAVVSNFETTTAFAFSLVSSVILGLNLSFGESTNLGYLKGFPGNMVGGYSTGTGFAGILGAGIPVILVAAEFSLFWVLCKYSFL